MQMAMASLLLRTCHTNICVETAVLTFLSSTGVWQCRQNVLPCKFFPQNFAAVHHSATCPDDSLLVGSDSGYERIAYLSGLISLSLIRLVGRLWMVSAAGTMQRVSVVDEPVVRVACSAAPMKGVIAAATATRVWRNDAPSGWQYVTGGVCYEHR